MVLWFSIHVSQIHLCSAVSEHFTAPVMSTLRESVLCMGGGQTEHGHPISANEKHLLVSQLYLVTLEINKTTAGNLKWDKCDIKQQRADRARFEGSWLSDSADISWCISSPASEENIFSLNFLLNFVLPELRLQRDQPRAPLLIWAAFRSVCSVHMRVTGSLRR